MEYYSYFYMKRNMAYNLYIRPKGNDRIFYVCKIQILDHLYSSDKKKL
jgi:hypothetical protein